MTKKQILKFSQFLFLMLVLSAPMSAQEIERSHFSDNLYIHIGLGSTTNLKSIDHGLSTSYMECSLGYYLSPKIFAFANLEGGFRLKEQNEQNVFSRYQNLGLGLGWRFYTSKRYGYFDWRTNASLFPICTDWKTNEYSTGLYWKLPSCRRAGISLSLGYKYYHSKTEGINSRGGIFATIGFSL